MKVALKIAVALAVAALMSQPAAAEWFAHGGYEPDTDYDVPSLMWEGPPGEVTNRVYFNVISGINVIPISFGKPTLNPNVGVLHTRTETPTLEVQHGWLGVWVDCNGDGYMGLAESALREYSATLLGTSAICPPVNGPTTSWTAGAHNYNGWVSEFIPIVDGQQNFDARVYVDRDAHVWGDFDRPDEHPFERNCPTTSFPRGALSTTGGILNYFDCRMDVLGPANDGFAIVGDPLGLRFADDDDATTGPLGQVWVYGPHGSEHAAVSTVDCDEDPILTVQTVEVREPDPTLGPVLTDPGSISVGGQLNQTWEEWVDDCDPNNDRGHEFTEFGIFGLEDEDFNSVNPRNKTEANWNFNVAGAQRGATPFIVGPLSGKAGAPQDAGQGVGGTHWLGDSIWTKFGPRTVRYDISSGSAGLARAYWLSFYANVGSATLDRGFELPGGSGVYGSWACGTSSSGIRNGWNCDTSTWYVAADGTVPWNYPRLAMPGWEYQLRDVDCYDGGIETLGVGTQPAYYGAEACKAT